MPSRMTVRFWNAVAPLASCSHNSLAAARRHLMVTFSGGGVCHETSYGIEKKRRNPLECQASILQPCRSFRLRRLRKELRWPSTATTVSRWIRGCFIIPSAMGIGAEAKCFHSIQGTRWWGSCSRGAESIGVAGLRLRPIGEKPRTVGWCLQK